MRLLVVPRVAIPRACSPPWYPPLRGFALLMAYTCLPRMSLSPHAVSRIACQPRELATTPDRRSLAIHMALGSASNWTRGSVWTEAASGSGAGAGAGVGAGAGAAGTSCYLHHRTCVCVGRMLCLGFALPRLNFLPCALGCDTPVLVVATCVPCNTMPFKTHRDFFRRPINTYHPSQRLPTTRCLTHTALELPSLASCSPR